jgi:two-component system osmolarity sensor histidine kinase EnvZ
MGNWLKSLLPTGLFGRSLLIIVSPLILLQVIASVIFYEQHWQIVSRRLASAVAGEVALAVAQIEAIGTGEERRQHLNEIGALLGVAFAWHDGEILANQSPDPDEDPVADGLIRAIDERLDRPFAVIGDAIERHLLVRVQLADGVLDAVVSRKRVHTSTTYVFMLWMVGSAMILFAVAGLFMRNQIRPIRRLAIAAERFGKGQNPGEVRIEGATEVRRAAIEFERMRERLTRQIQQRTDMLSGVSHDLRTPLTRMKLALTFLGDGPETDGLRTDIREMEQMLDAYLAFARGEAGETAEPTDLVALVEDVVEGARRGGTDVQLAVDGPVTLDLRPIAVRRGLANLIANACRHGRHVAVHLAHLDHSVEVTVDDDGPGVPRDRREDVFRPFVRLDPARSPQAVGVGLGLTIARDVMRSHGGDVLLEDSPYGGLRARVRLPG